eukprot:867268-Pelagomonas_calceolata.AAC.2
MNVRGLFKSKEDVRDLITHHDPDILSQRLKLLEEPKYHNGLTIFYKTIPGGTALTITLAQFSVSRKVLPLPPKPPKFNAKITLMEGWWLPNSRLQASPFF